MPTIHDTVAEVLDGRSRWAVVQADCLDVLRGVPESSIDALICDPPYGLGFMGVKWDTYGDGKGRKPSGKATFDQVGGNSHARKPGGVELIHMKENQRFQVKATEWAAAMLRVAKPGAHLVAFGGSRTFHRLTCAIEDAGWEIRDCLMWLYGSGFPKSLNVQQAINKAARGAPQGGADPLSPNHGKFKGGCTPDSPQGRGFGAGAGAFMQEASSGRGDDEGPWEGWGTALKPAWEPIILAREPLAGTVAANVAAHGTGGLNIDGCRIATDDRLSIGSNNRSNASVNFGMKDDKSAQEQNPLGRWPANLCLDAEAAEMLAAQGGPRGGGTGRVVGNLKAVSVDALEAERRAVLERQAIDVDAMRRQVDAAYGVVDVAPGVRTSPFYADNSGASRFFYCAKASRSERDAGLTEFPSVAGGMVSNTSGQHITRRDGGALGPVKNNHPTVKPIALMRWLCRLVTPPGGLILDPFAGSGTTGIAALAEGYRFIGVEREASYCAIARRRIADAEAQGNLFHAETITDAEAALRAQFVAPPAHPTPTGEVARG